MGEAGGRKKHARQRDLQVQSPRGRRRRGSFKSYQPFRTPLPQPVAAGYCSAGHVPLEGLPTWGHGFCLLPLGLLNSGTEWCGV